MKSDKCQKQGKIKKVSFEFHAIPVEIEVMQQTSVSVHNLPDVDSLSI